MKKISITIILATFILICIISFSNAACIVQGYVKDSSGNFKDYSLSGYCENTGTWRNITGGEGVLYYVSWGGPVDSCQSFCNQIYVKAEYASSIPEEPWLIGYTSHYPMNSGNTPNWNGRGAHNYNITLYEQEKIKEKEIKNKEPVSEEQQKINQEKAIKNFNSVITKEYKKQDININKQGTLTTDIGNWFITFWNRMIKFINGIFI